MNSKDKESKSFQDKLKQFLRLVKGNTECVRGATDLVITPELERELSQETPIPQRLRVIRELCESVITNRLQDQNTVERLWLATADLLHDDQPKECRHTELLFVKNLIQGQYELLTLMRVHFFRIIKEHDHPEDMQYRIQILQTLTDNGKDIKYFEEEIGRFMLQWMPSVSIANSELIQGFLALLINIIKFNASYLYEEIISGFVNNTCYLCCYSPFEQVVLGCLQVLDAVVCYSILPTECLQTFVFALCRTVNVEQYCRMSWKIMRCILGADLGHSALHVMCMALNSGDGDCALIRGAVFYLNMALWGPQRVPALKCTPTQVLPSFLKALEGKQSVVSYEVILAMQSLINKHGQELHEPSWDLIFSIIRTVIIQIDTAASPYPLTVSHLHDTITSIEQLHEVGHFNGNVDSLYHLVDVCGHSRPESSVMKLIQHMSTKVIPTNHEWLLTLNHLVERYCRQETRVNIRLRVLSTLGTIVEQNRYCYEEELLDGVVLPNLNHCSTEADPTIRCASAKLLIELALHCHSKRFSDIFDILEKLLNRQFELYVTTEAISLSPDTDISDVLTVASGMFKVFLDKLHKLPSQHAVRAYLTALRHLEMHYEKPSLFEKHPSVRLKLLEWFLSARANSMYHIGFPREPNGRVEYSPYLCVDGAESNRPTHSPTPQTHNSQSHVSYVSIRKACRIIVICLKQEKDWSVLSTVLREIPNVMQNKALVLSKNSNDIDLLASALCGLVTDQTMPDSLRNTNGKMTRSDFHASLLPVLSCLAPYHSHLDPQLQQRIVKYVTKFGLVSRCAQQCVTALTILTLEMRDIMVKLLPEVLLDLSKISATVYIAVPILEFLSTLTRLPKVYASFVGDQYMSVFAILLPYTNPFKYNHYIVSLAHHVIAAWFLKCRLPFRKDFVKFIKNGLHNNMLKPFEEGKIKQDFMDLNQDSSNRKRSSSLTEQGSRRRDFSSRSAVGESNTQQEVSNTFHIELTETCIDLMARYTYSPSICAPKRLQTAEFLLSDGQSMTWLVGHKIITITTSGCSQNPLRQGLCDRCLVLCKAHADSLQSPFGSGPPATSGTLTAASESDRGSTEGFLQTLGLDIKRYTKYSLQHSKSNETTHSSLSTSDNVLYPPSSHKTLSLQSLSGRSTRQNSSENKSSDIPPGSPKGSLETETPQPTQLSLKLENLANKQSCGVSGIGPRLEKIIQGGAGAAGGSGAVSALQCGCWCGGWAEVHVRTPTGDVSWVTRIQNQVNVDSLWNDFPLSDMSSLFLGGGGPSPLASNPSIPQHLGSAASIASSGFADAKSDVLSEGDLRSRSGSGGSQPEQIQKSSSDSVVGVAAPPPPHASTHCIFPPTSSAPVNPLRSHASTGPINIPGSPQRQSSSGTNTDDDDGQANIDDSQLFLQDDQKCRHPVRRSNSSPDMSSSWKNPFHVKEKMEAMEIQNKDAPHEVIASVGTVTSGEQPAGPTVYTQYAKQTEDNNTSMSGGVQQSKKAVMKSLAKDMRVSCEAIPEEMSGSTPPHPHLMTYKSDPGTAQADNKLVIQVSSSSSSQVNISKVTFGSDNPGAKYDSELFPKAAKPSDIKVAICQDVSKLSTKPPHSPGPASPRTSNKMWNVTSAPRQGLSGPSGRSNSLLPTDIISNAQSQSNLHVDDLPPVSRSKRSNTISVMSPTRRRRDHPSPKPKDSCSRYGASPAFVFLQLYAGTGLGGSERPLLLTGSQHTRSVKTLDLVPPLETYRVGVLYVAKGQHDNETKILKNEFGSLRYAEFVQDLGTLISLEDAESMGLFLDVEKGGRDGRFAYVWQDDIMQVLFHVATLMPNNPSDPECNEKRKHIGNDYVSIVYNESGEEFNIQTIKGHFNFACIIIEPLDHGTNIVKIKTKGELIDKDFLNTTEPKIISDQNVALLARQLALHANLASVISRSLSDKSSSPHASNWLERLRVIKRLRNKLLQERNTLQEVGPSYHIPTPTTSENRNRLYMEDFTDYT